MAENQESGLPDWANTTLPSECPTGPFRRNRAGARRIFFGQREASRAQQLQALLDTRERRWPRRPAFPNADGFGLVPVDPVDGIESANNCVVLRCGLKEHLAEQTLTHWRVSSALTNSHGFTAVES
jgi:hypothetical protein